MDAITNKFVQNNEAVEYEELEPVESKAQDCVDSKAKDIILSIADIKNMDEANKKALDVLIKGTEKDFLKHMFTNLETGQPRSYAEMRMIYG